MAYMSKGCVNPYNFIDFPKKKAKAYDDTDKHTGYIEYTIETQTPLFIPNSSSESAFAESRIEGHRSYDFFSYSELDEKKSYENIYNEPVIPGSEMRGVIRSVYETLTDSCMSVLNEDTHPVKRTSEPFKNGLLHRNMLGKLELLPAYSVRIGNEAENGKLPLDLNIKSSCKNGSVIYIRKITNMNDIKNCVITEYNDSRQGMYTQEGYLLKWGMGVRKKRYHIYVRDTRNKEIKKFKGEEISEIRDNIYTLIDSYMSQPAVKEYNKAAYEEYKRDFEAFIEGKGEAYFPINYSVIKADKQSDVKEDILYMSPAIFTKEISVNSISKLAGEFTPCKGTDICPACNMFGYIGNNNELSSGSKVRFTDLYVTEKKSDNSDYYLCNKVTIPALSGPKLGNVEFYLKRPKDATFWTYDYYVNSRGQIIVMPGELRGRKFYWHHGKVSVKDIKDEASNLNKTIRPVRSGVEFTGRLYYEGISEKQLNQLVWILNSGKEGLGYKLGGAKPLGLGSITCAVNSVVERHICMKDNTLSYNMEEQNIKDIMLTYEQVGFSKTVKSEFEKIASLKPFPDNVRITYPKADERDDGKGYEWFVNNHSKKLATRDKMEIHETLPYILDKDYILSYNARNNQRGNNHASGTKNKNRQRY